MKLNVFIKSHEVYSKPLAYILTVFAQNTGIALSLTDNKADAQLVFDHSDTNTIPVNVPFYDALLNRKVYDHTIHFPDGPMLLFPESRNPDWLGTAFYLLNAFQEYQLDAPDESVNYGRFQYIKSYQHRFRCIEKNIVQECFDAFFKTHLSPLGLVQAHRKTKVFLSHDIDMINGSNVQDALWALKKGRLDIMFRLIINEVLSRPHWKNIDKIVKIHSAEDLKSTFFWIATQKVGSNGIQNADYTIDELQQLSALTQSNGLHKSACDMSLAEELNLLPFKTTINRYHFLKFTLPQAWNALAEAKLELDASLGFAEHYGFRNSYGLPFKPYNVETGNPYNFIEVPLHVMDVTLQRYMMIPIKDTANHIIAFIEQNRLNAIISILWHNIYFTDYTFSGYLQEYQKIVRYLIDSGISSTTPEEMLNEFAHGH